MPRQQTFHDGQSFSSLVHNVIAAASMNVDIDVSRCKRRVSEITERYFARQMSTGMRADSRENFRRNFNEASILDKQ